MAQSLQQMLLETIELLHLLLISIPLFVMAVGGTMLV